MTQTLRWISGCSIALGLLVGPGCGKDDDGGDEGADDAATGDTTAGDDGASNTGASATSAGTTMTTGASMTGAVDDTGPGTITLATDEGTGGAPMPNGSMCDDDAECESMHCFVVGILGGICGECNTDADCVGVTDGGCTIPNPLAQPPQGATCNTGEHGAGCMTDDVCMEPFVCAEILNVPGVITASTCSECLTDADCMDNLCSPSYDVLNLSGSKDCVPPGSVPDGEGCDFMGTGDEACMSGACAIADVMGLLQLGVCSQCDDDMDCAMGEVCEAPSVDLAMGLIAGTCVPM